MVTPSLDQGRFLQDALESVVAQGYPAVEHIIVEGGSTDETWTVLERYVHLPHIRVIEDVPPRGQSAALNLGFRAASGEIIGWLNADDRYCEGAFAAAVGGLMGGEAALIYGDWEAIDEAGLVTKAYTAGAFKRDDLLNGIDTTVAQPTVFFRRELFDHVGYLDEDLHYTMDFDFWLRAAAVTEFKYLERPLAQFRRHAHSKSMSQSKRFYPEARRVARGHGGPFFSSAFKRRYLQDWIGPRLVNHFIWHWTTRGESGAGRPVVEPRGGVSKRCPLCRRWLLGDRP